MRPVQGTPSGLVRSFIAIEIPEDVKAGMGEIQSKLRKSGADVGWVRPGGIHLTLKFLGEVEPSKLDDIKAALKEAVAGAGPIGLEVRGAGVFPNAKAPRVVWLGLTGGLDKLLTLQENIEAACERAGFRRDDRPFRPHLTLGRVKSPGGRAALMRAVAELEGAEAGSFTATSVSLMKSELKPNGAVYTELAGINLGG